MATVEIWSVDLARVTASLLSLDAEHGLLAPEERDRASGLTLRVVTEERLAATIALRLLLERVAGPGLRGVPFTRNATGKPMLPDASCHFSLSHVDGWAVVALSTAPVGVDVERLRTVAIDPVRRGRIEAAAAAFAPASPRAVSSCGHRFLQAWTRLEALAKADGRGIGRLLTELGVLGAGRHAPAIDDGALPATIALLTAAHATLDLDLGGDLIGAVAGARGIYLNGPPRDLPAESGSLEEILRSSPESS